MARHAGWTPSRPAAAPGAGAASGDLENAGRSRAPGSRGAAPGQAGAGPGGGSRSSRAGRAGRASVLSSGARARGASGALRSALTRTGLGTASASGGSVRRRPTRGGNSRVRCQGCTSHTPGRAPAVRRVVSAPAALRLRQSRHRRRPPGSGVRGGLAEPGRGSAVASRTWARPGQGPGAGAEWAAASQSRERVADCWCTGPAWAADSRRESVLWAGAAGQSPRGEALEQPVC